jgi:hypothetical protein
MSENTVSDEVKASVTDVSGNENGLHMPKNNKANRYYYRHREEILEKQRQQRLKQKGIAVKDNIVLTQDELRKKKLEFLGLLEKS